MSLTQAQYATDFNSSPSEAIWSEVLADLSAKHGDAVCRSWLKPLRIHEVTDHVITLAAPSRFMKEWVSSNYMADMMKAWTVREPRILKIDILVKHVADELEVHAQPTAINQPSDWAPSESYKMQTPANQSATGANSVEDALLDSLHATLDPRYTFDQFVVGKPNELAFAAARRVAENDVVAQGCNPLFLYGGVGLGKTHLMHAIAWHIRENNPKRRVVYLSAEKFMYQFIRALRLKEAMEFKEYFRSVDVLMIDDVQFISGKDSTQEEFFHTFNALVDQNKQLVISCDRSPSDLEGMEERVRSRLGWGLVADIHATTYELRLGILQSKIESMKNIEVPAKVLEFLAHKISSNVRELEGALNRVVAHATLVGRAITLESTQEVLKDLLRANDRRITVEDIQKTVAAHFNIKIADMHSARRSRMVARPRQIAMYLAKRMTTKSLPEIGRRFGGKDHTTVMHAVKRVEELMVEDKEFAQEVELLNKLVVA